MRKLVVLAALAALPSLPAAADPGHPPDAAGFRCSLVSVTDPTAEGDVRSGLLSAAIVAASLPKMPDGTIVWNPRHNPVSGTVTCTLQVGSANQTHAGADAVAVSYTGTVVIGGSSGVSFLAAPGTPTWVCTAVTLWDAHGNGGTYFYDDDTGTWSTSTGASCEPEVSTVSGAVCWALGYLPEPLRTTARGLWGC